MITRRSLPLGWVALFVLPFACAEDAVFSGPQVGEVLPPFQVSGVFGEQAGKELNLVERAGEGPVLLFFVHARTRPAFGLTNTIMKYAATRAEDGLVSGVVFLADDATAMRQWMRRVERLFPGGVTHAIAPDGQEGPGAYGLNRNVTLTVLVAKQGKVTANFALVQPSLQADGPRILKAIVEATGGGKVPTIAELGGEEYQNRMRARMRRAAREAGKPDSSPPPEGSGGASGSGSESSNEP